MSTVLHDQARKELVQRAAQNLQDQEVRYGSADRWIERRDREELLNYCRGRIAAYLETVQNDPSANTDTLLADCLNHLVAIKAKLDMEKP